MSMNPAPAWIRRLLAGAGALFPLLVLGLWKLTPLGFWDAVFTTFLVEMLPIMAVVQLPFLDESIPLPRIPVYLSSGVVILGVGLGALALGGGSLGIGVMGLGPAPLGLVVPWTLGLTGGVLAIMGLFLVIRRKLGLRESPLLPLLLPETGREKTVFALLSLAAGSGEEMAYRGYLIPALSPVLGGEWMAAVFTSAVFGVLHAYQGWLGVVRTGVLGFVLAGSFIYLGSLWPAILAHALLDLLAGLVLGKALLKE